ncbi:hypothetical protein AB0M64_03155 [Streptomyces sp. NPDC051771]|uniref:hypothetical protein n=1 Tax=Streptomyces sp. NPDC051771 TaxID=3154847 RepID=UPI003439400F
MTTSFTDRDERQWQRYAEERPTRPLPVGAWLRGLRVLRAAPFPFRSHAGRLAARPAGPSEPQVTG